MNQDEKASLQQIEDSYVRQGYRGNKLRIALSKDQEYQKILAERKDKLTKNLPITASEKKKYVLSTDEDYEILSKCKQLESYKLSDTDVELVKLIKSQLEDDWRKPLQKLLAKLINKYG